MDLQFKSLPFEVKATPSGGGFEGKASVFFNIDSYNEIVDDKAFDQDLPDFLENGFIGGINHQWDMPIGKPVEGTRPMPDHLHVKASLVDTTHGMDVQKLLKAGVIKKLSIGYRVMGDMMLENEDECMAYWEQKGYKPNAQDMARCKMGARVLTRIHLYEASPVSVPANDLAMITAVKAAREAAEQALKAAPAEEPTPDPNLSLPANEREFEELLKNLGYSRSKAVAITNHGYKALLRDAASDDADPASDEPDDVQPEPTEADTPEPADDVQPDSSETLPDGDASDGGKALVTQPEHPDLSETLLVLPVSSNAAQLAEEKARIARILAQRQAQLDADIELALMRVAGS